MGQIKKNITNGYMTKYICFRYQIELYKGSISSFARKQYPIPAVLWLGGGRSGPFSSALCR
jgi:hypothetical protein